MKRVSDYFGVASGSKNTESAEKSSAKTSTGSTNDPSTSRDGKSLETRDFQRNGKPTIVSKVGLYSKRNKILCDAAHVYMEKPNPFV